MGIAHLPLALTLLVGCGPAEDALGPEVVATVAGHTVPARRYQDALAALAVQERTPELTRRHREAVLDGLIAEALLVDRAAALGLRPLDAGGPERAVLDAAAAEATATPPDESALRAYYQANREAFARTDAWHVEAWRFVGADADATAATAADMLAAGQPIDAATLRVPQTPLPFDTLAQYIGPTAARRAAQLAPGEVSRPTPYASGWLVVRLVTVARGAPPPYDAIRDAVLLRWRASAEREARVQLIASLRRDAEIRVNTTVRDAPLSADALARARERERTGATP